MTKKKQLFADIHSGLSGSLEMLDYTTKKVEVIRPNHFVLQAENGEPLASVELTSFYDDHPDDTTPENPPMEDIAIALRLVVNAFRVPIAISNAILTATADIYNGLLPEQKDRLDLLGNDESFAYLNNLLAFYSENLKNGAVAPKPRDTTPPLLFETYYTPGDGPYGRHAYFIAKSAGNIGTAGHGQWCIDEVLDETPQAWSIRRSTGSLLALDPNAESYLFSSVEEAIQECQEIEDRHFLLLSNRRPGTWGVENAK